MRKFLTVFLSLVFGAIVSAGIFLWMAAGEIYDYTDTFDLETDGPRVEVVVVLAGGRGRIPFAVNQWDQIRSMHPKGKTPVLFFSGVGPHTHFETLLEQGVPKELVKTIKKEDVVFENVSTNTFENAQIFASFVRQNQWKNVLLITTGYHMKRSEVILRKALDPGVYVWTETVDSEHFHRNDWHKDIYSIRVTIIEYIKWLFYRYSY